MPRAKQPHETCPDKSENASDTLILTDETSRLLPLVRVCEGWFIKGIVRISETEIAISDGRACDVTEAAWQPGSPCPGRNPRHYWFEKASGGDRIERVVVQQAGNLTPTSDYRRFVIHTARTTDEFWVPVTECRNVWRVLEAKLGDRLAFEDRPRLPAIEKVMLTGVLVGITALAIGFPSWMLVGWRAFTEGRNAINTMPEKA